MATQLKIRQLFLAIIIWFIASHTYANTWINHNNLDATVVSYQGDTTRQSVSDYGLSTKLQYLDKLDLVLGYRQTILKQDDNTNYVQTQLMLGGDWFIYADHPGARIGWHLNTWTIRTPSIILANIYSGGWSFLSYEKELYADLFLTHSNYTESSSSYLLQSNVALEFSPGLQSSWVSLQLFNIQDRQSVLIVEPLYSAHLEWTQRIKHTSYPFPGKIIFGTQFGEQRYLVNWRLNNVNNNPDSQVRGYWLCAIWQLRDHLETGASLASVQYKTDIDSNYEAIFTSVYLKFNW